MSSADFRVLQSLPPQDKEVGKKMGVGRLMFGPLGPECCVIHVLLAPLEYDHSFDSLSDEDAGYVTWALECLGP